MSLTSANLAAALGYKLGAGKRIPVRWLPPPRSLSFARGRADAVVCAVLLGAFLVALKIAVLG